jgi:hypothetical protein
MSTGRTYDFYMHDSRGRRDLENGISLPSVTTIIGATLAKPQLVAWAYQVTVDAVSGIVSEVGHTVSHEDLIDTLGDAVELDTYLRENKMHHTDVLDEASERGQKAHDVLQTLCRLYLDGSADAAMRHAERMSTEKIKDPFTRPVAGWWVQREPVPIYSEKVVFNLAKRYAGRLDAVIDFVEVAPALNAVFAEPVAVRTHTRRTIVDLKTRRVGLGMYDSDQIQLGGYELALVDMGLTTPGEWGKVVLLATDDGEPATETEAWVPSEAFLSLVDLYWLKRRTDSNGRKVR